MCANFGIFKRKYLLYHRAKRIKVFHQSPSFTICFFSGVSCPTDAAPRDYTTNNLKLNQIEAYRSIYSNILVGFLENKSKLEGINLYLR